MNFKKIQINNSEIYQKNLTETLKFKKIIKEILKKSSLAGMCSESSEKCNRELQQQN